MFAPSPLSGGLELKWSPFPLPIRVGNSPLIIGSCIFARSLDALTRASSGLSARRYPARIISVGRETTRVRFHSGGDAVEVDLDLVRLPAATLPQTLAADVQEMSRSEDAKVCTPSSSTPHDVLGADAQL
jgi:hypothetical protein